MVPAIAHAWSGSAPFRCRTASRPSRPSARSSHRRRPPPDVVRARPIDSSEAIGVRDREPGDRHADARRNGLRRPDHPGRTAVRRRKNHRRSWGGPPESGTRKIWFAALPVRRAGGRPRSRLISDDGGQRGRRRAQRSRSPRRNDRRGHRTGPNAPARLIVLCSGHHPTRFAFSAEERSRANEVQPNVLLSSVVRPTLFAVLTIAPLVVGML